MWTRRTIRRTWIPLLAAAALLIAAGAGAQSSDAAAPAGDESASDAPASQPTPAYVPEAYREVGVEEQLHEKLPLDIELIKPVRQADPTQFEGEPVKLREYFDGRTPVLMTLVYFNCPMLCGITLNELSNSLAEMDMVAGEDYELLVVSFNPAEGPQLAGPKQAGYAAEFGVPGAKEGWHFLTGDKQAVAKLAEAVGFQYAWNPATEEWVHAASVQVVTPTGILSRYFGAAPYDPKTLRLSLVEASDGKVGSLTDQLYLLCAHYNPEEGTYAASALKIMNITAPGVGALILVGVGVMIYRMKKRRAQEQSA